MKMKKVLALVLALVLVVSSFAGCAGGAGGSKKTLTLNAGMEPTGLNTLTMTYSIEFVLANHLYTTLVELDGNNVPVPGAAEWTVSDDGLVYTFNMRKDLKWSNGDACTANDFAFAWKQVLNPEVAADYAYFLFMIKNAEAYYGGECSWEDVGVKVIDDYTLEVTLENPTAYAPHQFSFGTFCPVNEKFYNEVGADAYSTEAEYFCTNGPYKLTKWTHNEEIVLEKNENYPDKDKLGVDVIDWKIITDGNAAYTAFEAGELDMVGLGTGELLKKASDAGLDVKTYSDGGAFYVYFNCKHEYLSNVNVRRALTYAIDKEKMISTVYQNNNKPMTSFTVPDVNGYDGKSFAAAVGELMNKNGDQAKAVECLDTALAELGITKEELSSKLSIDCGDSATAIAEASFYQEAWKNVLGLDVTVNSMITKQTSANRREGNFVMSITGWGPDYNDPMTFLDLWVTDGGNNQTGWSNARYDELIALATTETDLAKRQEYLLECEQIICDEFMIGPMYWRASSYVCSDKIESGMHRSVFKDIDVTNVKMK